MRVVNQRQENYDTYIGRAPGIRGIFGNPFKLGVHGDRRQVIEQYERWLRDYHADPEAAKVVKAIEALPEDAVLGCFCKPMPCHGDVIVKIWKEMHP